MFVRKPYKERKSKLSQLRLLNFLIDTAWSLNKIESSSYQTRTKKCNIKHTPDAGSPRESNVNVIFHRRKLSLQTLGFPTNFVAST